MGFVRNTVMGRFGEGQRYLDLKSSGLRPIVSLARVLAIRTGDAYGSTVQRLDCAASAGLLSRDEADTLTSAFTMYIAFSQIERILGMKRSEALKTFIAPAQLDPLTRAVTFGTDSAQPRRFRNGAVKSLRLCTGSSCPLPGSGDSRSNACGPAGTRYRC
ncbi:hypothetical protein J2809_004150 [Arthrobacter pascens]|nr:hypothetical protein [Arthrobacter pascens]MDR6559767.1 hypothetical protein [Arthrobacter pascens]